MDETLRREYAEYQAAGRIAGRVPAEYIRRLKIERIEPLLVARYEKLAELTTTLSDALDQFGVHGAVAGSHIAPLIAGRRVVGSAVTLRSVPERKTTTQCYDDDEALRMSTRDVPMIAEPGDVLICDFGGERSISNLGGKACEFAQQRGLAATIVHGAVRDVPTIRALDYPVWASGVTPVSGKFRMAAVEINGPVCLHGVAVEPGDLVAADDSGICVVPACLVARVIELAETLS